MDPLPPALCLLLVVACSIVLGFIFGKKYQKDIQKELLDHQVS